MVALLFFARQMYYKYLIYYIFTVNLGTEIKSTQRSKSVKMCSSQDLNYWVTCLNHSTSEPTMLAVRLDIYLIVASSEETFVTHFLQ